MIALMTFARAEIMKKTRTTSRVKVTMIWSTETVCSPVTIMTMCVMLIATDSTMRIFKIVLVNQTVPMAVHAPIMSVPRQRQMLLRQSVQQPRRSLQRSNKVIELFLF